MSKNFDYKPTDGNGIYSVFFTNSVKAAKSKFSKKKLQFLSPICIVDKNLPKSYIQTVTNITGLNLKNSISVDPASKDITKIIPIWEKMVSTVPDCAIVIGGGTICDIAGFACANYQRGIPRILFPTTVLSMVDASIGGKSGIDFGGVKNSIGALHYPLLTANYLPFLDSLSKQEFDSGFAEIIKSSVLYDKDFFKELQMKNLESQKTNNLIEIFYKSSKLKAEVCEANSKKKISLLYGHAIGHAIERFSIKHLRHGECITIGMTIEGAIGCLLGVWKKEEWLEQQKLILKYNLPTTIPDYIGYRDLINKMQLYKKLVTKDSLLFSLPKKIGYVNNSETNYLTPIKKSEILKIVKKSILWAEENGKTV